VLAGNLVLDVSADKLELIQTVDVADISNPGAHDVILGPDGNFLCVIEVRTRRILVYSIRKDDELLERGEPVMPRRPSPWGWQQADASCVLPALAERLAPRSASQIVLRPFCQTGNA